MGQNTKDTLQERIEFILEGSGRQIEVIQTETDGEIRRIKQSYNSQVLKELESNLQDKEDGYNSGFITVHECLKLKVEHIKNAIKELYTEEEVEHPTEKQAKDNLN